MTTSVKERLKVELEQAQSEGKQRAGRISDILKAAASMTFEELKEGSSELNVVTRKSVAEILAELQEPPEVATEETVDSTAVVEPQPVAEEDTTPESATIPTWKTLLRNAIAVVRARRGDWFQAFKEQFQKNAAKADQEIMDQYGDRYTKVKDFFQRVVEQIKTSQAATQTASTADSQPVSIEVVEEDAVVDVTPTVQQLESENQA